MKTANEWVLISTASPRRSSGTLLISLKTPWKQASLLALVLAQRRYQAYLTAFSAAVSGTREARTTVNGGRLHSNIDDIH